MSFEDKDLGIAASVYLGLYLIFLGVAIYVLIQRGWKTRFTFFTIYGLIRVGGQISGIGFATQGLEHYQWLIAYIVLSAEGYFTLVLSSLFFLIKVQETTFGSSYLVDKKFGTRFIKRSFKDLFHFMLVAANVFIIAGSSISSGDDNDLDESTYKTAKGLRVAGQVIFFVLSFSVSVLTVWTYFVHKIRTGVIVLLLAAIPFITVRGIFGVLSIFINAMNYVYLPNYYTKSSFRTMTVYEYVLGTTMEYVTAWLLLTCHWFRKDLPPVVKDEVSLEDSNK